MLKKDAIQRVRKNSNFDLNNSNTCFANINTGLHKGKNVWWLDVSPPKFDKDFYFLLCDWNETLILLEIPKNGLDLEAFEHIETKSKDCYRLHICCNLNDPQYMHDLRGPGQIDLRNL